MTGIESAVGRLGLRASRACFALATALGLLVLAASTGARAEDVSGCLGLEAPPKVAPKLATNLQLFPDQLITYRCQYYLDEMTAVLAKARDPVMQLAPQFDKAAGGFDIDETSLSNWEAMYHNKFVFAADGPCDLSSASLCGEGAWDLSARA